MQKAQSAMRPILIGGQVGGYRGLLDVGYVDPETSLSDKNLTLVKFYNDTKELSAHTVDSPIDIIQTWDWKNISVYKIDELPAEWKW